MLKTAILLACFPLLMVVAADPVVPQQLLGRWDVTVEGQKGTYPSWFEIKSEQGRLAGSFVGQVGSARPIRKIEVIGQELRFSLPKQYEKHKKDMAFTGVLRGSRLEGTTNAEDGSTLKWTAVRAPELPARSGVKWGETTKIFNGKDLAGWHVRLPNAPNKWQVEDGTLKNTGKGVDLITDQKFQDFKVHLEFRYPAKSNSGLYLRGRYEVQIQDDFGKKTDSHYIGGVYGFLTPTTNAGKRAGEWQSYDITLIGRRVTIDLNGTRVVDNQEIPGITGGALDSNEGEPGPFMLQGDHGEVWFRNITVTPAS